MDLVIRDRRVDAVIADRVARLERVVELLQRGPEDVRGVDLAGTYRAWSGIVSQTNPDGITVAAQPSNLLDFTVTMTRDGHGTWVLSAIAAPINGFGVSGVAPDVTTVALKVLDRNGRGSSASVAQALVYAGQSHFDVASMSIGVYLDSKADKADVTLVQRAVDFARRNGVLPIGALNNDNLDLSDNEVMGKTVELPADLDGVVGVSATGYANQKAYYSNYGSKETDVAAPGGDKRFQVPPAPYRGGGRLLAGYQRLPQRLLRSGRLHGRGQLRRLHERDLSVRGQREVEADMSAGRFP